MFWPRHYWGRQTSSPCSISIACFPLSGQAWTAGTIFYYISFLQELYDKRHGLVGGLIAALQDSSARLLPWPLATALTCCPRCFCIEPTNYETRFEVQPTDLSHAHIYTHAHAHTHAPTHTHHTLLPQMWALLVQTRQTRRPDNLVQWQRAFSQPEWGSRPRGRRAGAAFSACHSAIWAVPFECYGQLAAVWLPWCLIHRINYSFSMCVPLSLCHLVIDCTFYYSVISGGIVKRIYSVLNSDMKHIHNI